MIPLIALPFVNADNSQYLVPVGTSHWNINPIPVRLFGSNHYRNMSRQALQTWNDAQAWFNSKYYPNQPPRIITLIEGGVGSPVEIHFMNQSSVNGFLGETWMQTTPNGTIMTGAQVKISVYYKDTSVFTTIEHELGHVIGLIHTNCATCKYDLMWGAGAIGWEPVYDLVLYPSTLDLYAVHAIASQTSYKTTLPQNINYEAYQGNGIYESALPLPEFPFSLLLTFVSVLTAGLILRVKSKKQYPESLG